MCNAYEQHVRWVEYSQMMQDLELGIPTQQTELDLPQSDLVRINDMAPVMRAAGNGVELVPMNFSFAPSGAKGGPVFNSGREGGTSPIVADASFRPRVVPWRSASATTQRTSIASRPRQSSRSLASAISFTLPR